MFGTTPDPSMERLHGAVLHVMWRAKMLLIAIGGPDGMLLRHELDWRQRHRSNGPRRTKAAKPGHGAGPGDCGDSPT